MANPTWIHPMDRSMLCCDFCAVSGAVTIIATTGGLNDLIEASCVNI